jgi:hypothetical protein
MHPALVLHTLHLHDGFIRRRLEHSVVAAGTWVFTIDCTTERRGPELSGPIDIDRPAIDQQRTKA